MNHRRSDGEHYFDLHPGGRTPDLPSWLGAPNAREGVPVSQQDSPCRRAPAGGGDYFLNCHRLSASGFLSSHGRQNVTNRCDYEARLIGPLALPMRIVTDDVVLHLRDRPRAHAPGVGRQFVTLIGSFGRNSTGPDTGSITIRVYGRDRSAWEERGRDQ